MTPEIYTIVAAAIALAGLILNNQRVTAKSIAELHRDLNELRKDLNALGERVNRDIAELREQMNQGLAALVRARRPARRLHGGDPRRHRRQGGLRCTSDRRNRRVWRGPRGWRSHPEGSPRNSRKCSRTRLRVRFQVLQKLYATLTRKVKPAFDTGEARAIVRDLAVWRPVTVDLAILERGWHIPAIR